MPFFSLSKPWRRTFLRAAFASLLVGALVAPATAQFVPIPRPQGGPTIPPAPVIPTPAAPDITTEEAALLAALNTYFSQVVTLRGEFIQEGPDARQLSEGVFYLYRPGRVRFEYYPPSQMLIVSNGRTLQIENRATQTRDRYPLGRTPLAPLLAETIDLTSPANVRDVRIEGDLVAIVLAAADDGGVLTLYFNRTTFDLYQWITLDAQGNTIRFVIYNLATNQALDLAMFDIAGF